MPHYATRPQFLCLLLALLLLLPAAAAQAAPGHSPAYNDNVQLFYADARVQIDTAANAAVSFELRNAQNALVETRAGATDGSGYYEVQFTADFAPGDTVVAHTPYQTRQIALLPFSLTVDPAADTISGSISGSGPGVIYNQMDYTVFASCSPFYGKVTPDGAGHFSANLASQADIMAGAYVKVSYKANNGVDLVHLVRYAPGLIVRLGESSLAGYAVAPAEVTARLLRNGQTLGSYSASVTRRSFTYWPSFYNATTSAPEPVQPGDTVQLTINGATRNIPVGNFSATFDLASATVAGQAPAYARLRVQPVKWMYGYYTRYLEACLAPTADAGGHYSITGAGWGLAIGDYVSVSVSQPGGDVWEVNAHSTSPTLLDATPSGPPTPGAPVTISWQVAGAQHVPSASLSWSTTSHPAGGDYGNYVAAQTTDGIHFQATFTIPASARGSLYFRTYAYADGLLLESPEKTAPLGASPYKAWVYLPLAQR